MVAYRFEDSRSGDCVARHLEGYRGILQIDGYAAYNRVARPDRGNDGALLAGCWAHGRRRFYELHANDSSKVATATIEKMGALWSIEEKVRGQSSAVRVAARQEASAAIVADLYKLWRKHCPASLENQSSPKPFAMPFIDGKPSNNSSMTGVSK